MTDPSTAASWVPQPRPPWVTDLNRFGATAVDPGAVVSLDEASLLAAAAEVTGLDDFGGDEWREPFRILLDDLDKEAELNLVGRILARTEILRSLLARLRMTETEKHHPEILEQSVEAPVFITGMGRTGTSILFELMAEDPGLRAPLGWELRYPSPLPETTTRDDDPRVAKGVVDTEMWVKVVPEFLAIHETTSGGPDECVVGMQHEFTSQVWSAPHRVPNYDAWLMGSGMTQGFRFHRRLLQHLQWKTPGRWLLKAPTHLACLPTLFAEYPDAHVIQTHRDPLKLMASTADMMATLRWQRSDRVDYDEYVQGIAFGYPFLLDMVIDQRETGVVPEDRFIDVRFADLMQDHLVIVADIDCCHGDQIGIGIERDMPVTHSDLALEIALDIGLVGQLRCAADVEGAHGQLRARLADRLRRNHAHGFTHVDRRAASQIAPVAIAAHTVLGLAGQH